jgi:hypothetical protein
MDFTTAGARGAEGGHDGERARLTPLTVPMADQRRIMSSFAGDPQTSGQPEHNGPVLVMPPPQKPKRRQLWLKRFWLVVFVLFCLEVGIILTVVPWTRVWAENSLLLGHPRLHDWLQQNFVRGLISGLGLVDIWMGIAEAVRYREGPDA